MTNTQFDQAYRKAHYNVAAMDKVDGRKTRDRDLPTIREALNCGLRRPSTNAAFDALVMLDDYIRAVEKCIERVERAAITVAQSKQ